MKAYSGLQQKTKRKTKNRVLSISLLWNKIYFLDFRAKFFLVMAFSGEACRVAVALAPECTGTGISRYATDIRRCCTPWNIDVALLETSSVILAQLLVTLATHSLDPGLDTWQRQSSFYSPPGYYDWSQQTRIISLQLSSWGYRPDIQGYKMLNAFGRFYVDVNEFLSPKI